ncbi:CAP domain-containing protein [Sphingomonas lutea]|uniref:CAP domain-containing protein n=1 Tax=Sphingomonas lutea TaxID=1045317 RepID=UPI001FD2D0C6|nr:CAP domain-containing protein [Sphingomonas lutea]
MKRAFAWIFLGFVAASTSALPATARTFSAAPSPARFLAAHNAVRAQAGVRPLAWDPALAHSASLWARQLAYTNRFEHSHRRARRGVGENLWMGSRGVYPPEQMVGQWASERRWFRPGVFPAVGKRGWAAVSHYTQMVWPTTTRIGCALISNARSDFLVCHYSPAGNIDGRWVG